MHIMRHNARVPVTVLIFYVWMASSINDRCIFFGTQSGLKSSKNPDTYAAKLEKRLKFAYKTAASEVEKASKRHKARYDLRVRNSVLKPGDRVLVKNVSLRDKHKLANKWERCPYIVQSQPDNSIPVYTLKREFGQGTKRTVHRNLLLPIGNTEISSVCENPSEISLNNCRRKESNSTMGVIGPNSEDNWLPVDEERTDGDFSDSSEESEVCLIPTRELLKQTSCLDPLAPEFSPALRANTSSSDSSRLSYSSCMSDTNVRTGDTCTHTTSSETETGVMNENASQHLRVESEQSESSEISRESARQSDRSSMNIDSTEPKQIVVRRSSRVSKPPERFSDYIRY